MQALRFTMFVSSGFRFRITEFRSLRTEVLRLGVLDGFGMKQQSCLTFRPKYTSSQV